MLEDERFAVEQNLCDLHECLLPIIDATVTHFNIQGYISMVIKLSIEEKPRIDRPLWLIRCLQQIDSGWVGLHQFLRSNKYDELSKKLHVTKENFIEKPKSNSETQIVDKFFTSSFISQSALNIGTTGLSQIQVAPKSLLSSLHKTIRKPWNAPLKVSQFVGRTLLLEKLTKLQDPKGSPGASRQAQPTRILATCAGIGGVGKSSLALEFAYKNLNIYSNIFWISATSKEIIETRLMELAEELGFSASGEKRSWKDAFSWLHTSSNWLMIFDDAQDYGSIKEYIPRINGDVVITSRYSIWPHQVLNVDAFTKEEALSCISAYLPKADNDAATVLANELENFPLALVQACAYVVQRHISIEVYLEKLKQSRADILAINILPHDCDSKPVYSTWNITVEQIGKECEFTVTLLEFCSLLEGHSIPDCLLHKFAKNRNQSTEVYEKSRSLLCNYLLLTAVEQNNSIPCVSVHPLVQTITATKLTVDIIYEHCIKAHACIHQLWPDLNDKQYAKWSSALMPQLLKCLKHIHVDADQPLQATMAVQQITKTHTEHTLANKQISRNDTELIYTSTIFTGQIYRFRGDYNKAKQELQKVLLTAQNLFGDQSTKVAYALNELGVVYSQNGEYTKAKELHEKALKIREAHYGPDHIEVATSLNNLGSVYQKLGEYTKAKELHEKDVKITEAHYGPDHIVVATSFNNLGLVYGNLGEYTKAKELHEKALKITEAHYGPDHIEGATSLNNLGSVYQKLVEYTKAKELYEKALEIREAHYGPDHIVVATSLNNLGLVYGDLGEYTKAKELHEKALKITEAHYGPDHIEVATSLNNLGSVYQKLGEYTKAKELHEKDVKITEAHYGPDHIEVATSLNNLGLVHRNLGEYTKAKELHEKALKIREAHYGPDHIVVAISLHNLGSVYRGLGEYTKAKELHEKALKIREAHYGPDHIEVATSLNNLGLVYENLGEYTKAKELHEKALKIREAHYGPDHIVVATSLNNQGLVYEKLGEFTKAKELHEKALKIREAHYGPDHIEVATSLNNLGSVCDDLGDYRKARELIEETQKSNERQLSASGAAMKSSAKNSRLCVVL